MTDDLATEAGLDAALDRIDELPADRDRIVALNALIREADASGSREAQRRVRAQLCWETRTGSVIGLTTPGLAAFAWLLADHDRDPEGGVPAPILGNWYVEMAPNAARDPAVPRERVEALLADQRRRAAAWGGGESEAVHTAFWTAVRMLDLEKMPPLLAELRAAGEKDGLGPPSFEIALGAILCGQTDAALAAIEPLARRGDRQMAIWLLRPLVWAGRTDEAAERYKTALSPGFRGDAEPPFVLEYAARVRDVKVLRRWLPPIAAQIPSVAGDAAIEVIHLCQACLALADAGDEPLALPIPDDLPNPPPRDDRGRVRPSEAAPAYWAAASAWAAQMDARNGHTHYTTLNEGDRRFVEDPSADPCRVPADLRAELRELWEAHLGPVPGSDSRGGSA